MGCERRSIWRLLMAAAISCGPVTASAQQTPLLPELPRPESMPHPFGQLRMGMWAFTPTLKITNVGFDTNVFDLNGTERRPPDFTATIEPGVETRLTTDRLEVSALTRTSLVYYRTYGSERALNPGVDLTVNDRLSSHVALFAKGVYGYAKDRIGFEIDNRPRSASQSTTAGARLGGRKLELDVYGRYTDIAFDRNSRFLSVDLSQTLNHSTVGAGGRLGYRLSPYTSVTAGFETSFDRFGNSPERDTNSVLSTVGLRFSPRAMIAGEAAFGYKRVDPRDPRVPSFAGITPAAGLSYRLGEILVVSVGGQRDVQNSFYGDRPYFVYTLYEGSIRQALFHHLDIGASVQYTTLEYRRFLDASTPAGVPRDIVRMGTINLGVPIARQIRFGVFTQLWERISNERPYRTTRTGIEMSVGRASLSPRGVFLSGPAR